MGLEVNMGRIDDHHHRSPDEREKMRREAQEREAEVAQKRDPQAVEPSSKQAPSKKTIGPVRGSLMVGAWTARQMTAGVGGEPPQMPHQPVVAPTAQVQPFDRTVPVSGPVAAPVAPVGGEKREVEVDDEPTPEKREPQTLKPRHNMDQVQHPPPADRSSRDHAQSSREVRPLEFDPFVRPEPRPEPSPERLTLADLRTTPPRPVTPER